MAVALVDLDALGDGSLIGADPGGEWEREGSDRERLDWGLGCRYHPLAPCEPRRVKLSRWHSAGFFVFDTRIIACGV